MDASSPVPTWEWPESLDALVAAPGYHRLVFENDDVRVLETAIGPGELVPVHTHRWPSVLFVHTTSHFVRRDADGAVLADTREAGAAPEPGTCIWMGPMAPHTFENVGDAEIRVLNVELKR